MSYIDLHMHSICSDDGEFEPKNLVDLCLEKDIKYFSIADHNCVKGIKEAKGDYNIRIKRVSKFILVLKD